MFNSRVKAFILGILMGYLFTVIMDKYTNNVLVLWFAALFGNAVGYGTFYLLFDCEKEKNNVN